MRKRIKVTGFSDWDSMFYNNLLSIPVLLVFSFVLEDWGSANLDRNLYVHTVPLSSGRFAHVYFIACSPPETRGLLLFAITFSGAAAVGISYTTAWCIRVTSSTTYR
jgi:GDP-mannose transporter